MNQTYLSRKILWRSHREERTLDNLPIPKLFRFGHTLYQCLNDFVTYGGAVGGGGLVVGGVIVGGFVAPGPKRKISYNGTCEILPNLLTPSISSESPWIPH